MSNLSQQECTAGISRSALATLKRIHGNGSQVKAPDPWKPPATVPAGPAPATPHLESSEPARSIADGVSELAIIATPFRRLSILENMRMGEVIVRDASFVGSKCEVHLIHLDYQQARTLGEKLSALREEPDQATKRPGRRYRA